MYVLGHTAGRTRTYCRHLQAAIKHASGRTRTYCRQPYDFYLHLSLDLITACLGEIWLQYRGNLDPVPGNLAQYRGNLAPVNCCPQ